MQTMLLFLVVTQAPAEVVVAPAESWWVPLLQGILTALGGLFLWLVKLYGGKLVALVAEKSGSDFLGELVSRSLITVLHMYQTEVRFLKGTVKWDDGAKARLKQNAVAHLRMVLDPEKVKAAAGEMGIDAFLGQYVEAAVATSKASGRIVKVPELVVPEEGEAPDPTEGSTSDSPN